MFASCGRSSLSSASVPSPTWGTLPHPAPAAAACRRRRAQAGHAPALCPRALLPGCGELLLAALSALDDPAALSSFEPRGPGPAVTIAVACAAAPPILFWARIFNSAQKRQQAIEEEKAAEEQKRLQREELKRKITGQQGPGGP